MVRRTLLALALLTTLLLPSGLDAGIIVLLRDPLDDTDVVRKVQEDPAIRAFQKEVRAFGKRLLQWKERDFQAIFGNARVQPGARYAMMSTEPRVIGMSGRRYADPKLNKDHTESYHVGNTGRLDVYYSLDGVTPVHVHFYLRADKGFIKLDRADKLQARLFWERAAFARVVSETRKRWREVVVWEVDADKQKAQSQGMGSGDLDARLRAMLRWGVQQGYRLDHQPARGDQTPRWTWFLGEKMMAEAYHDRGFKGAAGKPSNFIFYRPDGQRLRDDGGWPSVQMIRWYRPDGTMVRSEHGSQDGDRWKPTGWSWYDKDGKAVRTEFDTNGDGVPDRVLSGEFFARAPTTTLAVERSWAVHPELIPVELRTADDPSRRLPLRKIAP
jgi:hypothetical protein